MLHGLAARTSFTLEQRTCKVEEEGGPWLHLLRQPIQRIKDIGFGRLLLSARQIIAELCYFVCSTEVCHMFRHAWLHCDGHRLAQERRHGKEEKKKRKPHLSETEIRWSANLQPGLHPPAFLPAR